MSMKNLTMVCSLCLGALLVAPSAWSAVSQAAGDGKPGAITTTARVSAEDMDGKEIPLKPEEKIALMFLEAISSMESDCHNHVAHLCSLEELLAGPKSPDWNIGKLKFDPAQDKNYKYTVTISGNKWQGHADPQRKGLGGWFYDGGFFIAHTYFNPNGPATSNNTRTGSLLIDGDSFRAR